MRHQTRLNIWCCRGRRAARRRRRRRSSSSPRRLSRPRLLRSLCRAGSHRVAPPRGRAVPTRWRSTISCGKARGRAATRFPHDRSPPRACRRRRHPHRQARRQWVARGRSRCARTRNARRSPTSGRWHGQSERISRSTSTRSRRRPSIPRRCVGSSRCSIRVSILWTRQHSATSRILTGIRSSSC